MHEVNFDTIVAQETLSSGEGMVGLESNRRITASNANRWVLIAAAFNIPSSETNEVVQFLQSQGWLWFMLAASMGVIYRC